MVANLREGGESNRKLLHYLPTPHPPEKSWQFTDEKRKQKQMALEKKTKKLRCYYL